MLSSVQSFLSPLSVLRCGSYLSVAALAYVPVASPVFAAGSAAPVVAPTSVASAKELLTPAKMQDIFNSLDYDNPAFAEALAPVRVAVQSNDYPAAVKALAEYLRTRNEQLGITTWRITPEPAPVSDAEGIRYDAKTADAAAEGRVVGGLVELEAVFPDNVINWRHNETRARADKGKAIAYNPEWQWQLNRMGFWHEMARAYRVTGDEKYARAWVKQFRSFIEQCPPPPVGTRDNSHGSPWRTIETGLRMIGTWPHSFHSYLYSPSVSDEDLLLYLHATLEHARHIMVTNGTGNWLTMEMNGLYTAGTVFPELLEAQGWRNSAIERLSGQLGYQFLPDGAQFELTPGYHHVALDNTMGPMRMAIEAGYESEFPADYLQQVEHAWEYSARMMTPDGSLPKVNDSWPVDLAGEFRKNRVLEYFPHRKDFLWVLTNGREGHPPPPAKGQETASYAFDHAGYYVMRSGWDADANYLLFDGGLLGAGHVHQDKLNVIFYPWGRELLFDGGGGSYEQSPWRHYGMDTFSHNTVLVDGLPQRRNTRNLAANVARSPLQNVWESTPQYDYAQSVYDEGYGREGDGVAIHMRRVYFHKPDVVVVADTLLPRDMEPHSYQARWHLLTTSTRTDAQTGEVITADDGLANLAVIPLGGVASGLPEVATASGQTEPEILGWDVRKDTIPQNVPATSATHTLNNQTGPATFLTLLLPLRPGEDTSVSPVLSIEPATRANPNETTVVLRDGRRLRIEHGAAPDSKIRVIEAQ